MSEPKDDETDYDDEEEIIRAKAKERQAANAIRLNTEKANNFGITTNVPNCGHSEDNSSDYDDEEEITGFDDDSEPFLITNISLILIFFIYTNIVQYSSLSYIYIIYILREE